MNNRKKVFLKGLKEDNEKRVKKARIEKTKKTAKKAFKELFYFSIFRTIIDIILFIFAVIGITALLYPESRVLLIELYNDTVKQLIEMVIGGLLWTI